MYNLDPATPLKPSENQSMNFAADQTFSVVDSEDRTRRLLYLGENGRFICQHMVDLNYIGLAINDDQKALRWLDDKIGRKAPLPDAIICDSQLITGDIYEFYQNIQKRRELKDIPFIVLAQNAAQDDMARAVRYGIDDFYVNTFDAEDLHYRIKFLNEYKRNRKVFEEDELEHQTIELKQLILNIKMPTSKRIFDVSMSLLSLILLSPVFLLIAVLIKLESRGPVFYVSKRAGTGYHIFNFYKFRTMRVGADAELKKLQHLNQYSHEGDAAFVKINNDPRITRIGHFLRKSSLDELPQLFNVLIGDMSIVGNRPLPLYEAEQLTKDQWARRFLAPAGITGLWQVTKRGRKEMSESERMALDILYAKKYSFWMDMKIIFKTFPALMQKESV